MHHWPHLVLMKWSCARINARLGRSLALTAHIELGRPVSCECSPVLLICGLSICPSGDRLSRLVKGLEVK